MVFAAITCWPSVFNGIPVNTEPLPIKKFPVTLPVAVISPTVRKLPPCTLPVELNKPPVKTLPIVALPLTPRLPVMEVMPSVVICKRTAAPVSSAIVNEPLGLN